MFQMFYICLEGCKNAFVKTCEPLIGLDAYLLKDVFVGKYWQLLRKMKIIKCY